MTRASSLWREQEYRAAPSKRNPNAQVTNFHPCRSVLMASTSSQPAPSETSAANVASDDEASSRDSFFLSQRDLPPLPDVSPHVWNKHNEKQLRSALIGACKRMPRNAEAHFHLGLMYMRSGDFQPALRSFQHARNLTVERFNNYQNNNIDPPAPLKAQVARIRSHCAQAAHLVALVMERDKHTDILSKTQKELIASIKQDCTSPDAWNALGLVHLNEGGSAGARDVFRTIRQSFPDYLDALNNVGVAELGLGNEELAISCFQKVLLCDREHVEALSNYGVVLLRHGMYDAAVRAFSAAVKGSPPDARGLSFAWGALAVAHAALGNLDAADMAAQRAESSAAGCNRPQFSMLRASVYARRVADARRRGVSLDATTSTFCTPERAHSLSQSSHEGTGASEGGSNSRDAGDGDDISDGDENFGANEISVADKKVSSAGDHQNAVSCQSAPASELSNENLINESKARPSDYTSVVRSVQGEAVQIKNETDAQIKEADLKNERAASINGEAFLNDSDHRPIVASNDQLTTSVFPVSSVIPSNSASIGEDLDPRPAIDSAVLRLRALARELHSSSASTALGAALRLRHDCAMEESGNRNFGAEAAERLVEALEIDDDDATAWVQLGLLQLGTGEYISAKEFCVQAVSRNGNIEAGWNALAVACQLNDDPTDAASAFEMALNVINTNYCKSDRWSLSGDPTPPNTARRLVFPLPDAEGSAGELPDVSVDEEGCTISASANRRSSEQNFEIRRSADVDESEEDVSKLNTAGRNALAAVYNNLGNLRRQEGRDFSEALTAYQKSLKYGGENPVVYNNLALLYISSNKLEDASKMLDHALKLDPRLECAVSNRLKLTALMRNRESSAGAGEDDLDDFADDLDGDDQDDNEEDEEMGDNVDEIVDEDEFEEDVFNEGEATKSDSDAEMENDMQDDASGIGSGGDAQYEETTNNRKREARRRFL